MFNPASTNGTLLYITALVLMNSSFFSVVAISVDRFLAIHLHLRYQELVTHKRVVAVVISIWGFSAVLTPIWHWTSYDIAALFNLIIQSLQQLFTAKFILLYYIDTSVLLENIPLVKFIKTTSGTRVVYFP